MKSVALMLLLLTGLVIATSSDYSDLGSATDSDFVSDSISDRSSSDDQSLSELEEDTNEPLFDEHRAAQILGSTCSGFFSSDVCDKPESRMLFCKLLYPVDAIIAQAHKWMATFKSVDITICNEAYELRKRAKAIMEHSDCKNIIPREFRLSNGLFPLEDLDNFISNARSHCAAANAKMLAKDRCSGDLCTVTRDYTLECVKSKAKQHHNCPFALHSCSFCAAMLTKYHHEFSRARAIPHFDPLAFTMELGIAEDRMSMAYGCHPTFQKAYQECKKLIDPRSGVTLCHKQCVESDDGCQQICKNVKSTLKSNPPFGMWSGISSQYTHCRLLGDSDYRKGGARAKWAEFHDAVMKGYYGRI